MTPSSKHEKYKELILRLADTAADELGCDLDSFRLHHLQAGTTREGRGA
jgi:hypothetical protein